MNEPWGMLDEAELPARYGTDTVHAMARDPGTLFIYWELTEAGRGDAAARLPAAARALDSAGHPTLEGIGLANQGETVLPWRRDTGEPLGRAIVWQDRRSLVECERRADRSEWLAHLTGLELDPYFVAPKIAWLRPQVPADAAQLDELAQDLAAAGLLS